MSTIGNKWNSWKTNESIGNPMKSMGNLMKSFGKFIASTGKPMKSIGKQRKSIGSPMQSIEKQWHPLGNPWNPLENKWNPNDMTSHYDMANLRIMACESRHVIPWWLMPLIFNQYAMRHGCWGQATPHCNFLWGGACLYTCPPPQRSDFLGEDLVNDLPPLKSCGGEPPAYIIRATLNFRWEIAMASTRPMKSIGKPMGPIGKQLKSMGKTVNSIGIPMKSIAKPIKSVGKPMRSVGKPMKSMGKQMNTIGNQWNHGKPIYPLETQWKSWETKWNPMEN